MNVATWQVAQRARINQAERRRAVAESEVDRLQDELLEAQNRVGEADADIEAIRRETYREAAADHAFDEAKERSRERRHERRDGQ